LLTFFAITGDDASNQQMVTIRRIQNDFAADGRLAMMGLTHGGMLLVDELVKKFMVEQGLTWQQGFINNSNMELIQKFRIQGPFHAFLIGPDGTLLANGLTGQELYDAVAKAMMP